MVTRRQLLYASSGLTLGALLGCTAEQTSAPAASPSSAPVSLSPAPPAPADASDCGTEQRHPVRDADSHRPPRPEIADTIADDFDVPWG